MLFEPGFQRAGYNIGSVKRFHGLAVEFADLGFDQRIMRAAEYQCFDSIQSWIRQVIGDHAFADIVVEESLLDHRRE
ncbi:hypothetical protein D3C87_1998060 [compost metagenome]